MESTSLSVAIALILRNAAQARLCDARTVELAARDALLLAWLAVEGPTPRARLASLLWPASTDDAARNALRQRLHSCAGSAGPTW